MRRGVLLLVLPALGAGALLSGCGLATKQADEKRIASATARALASPRLSGLISAVSFPLPPHRPLPPGPNRIGYFATGLVPLVIDPAAERAAVRSGGSGGTTQLLFTSEWMYQRRPVNPSAGAAALLASSGSAPSNLPFLKAAPPLSALTGAASGSTAAAPAANSSLAETAGSASTTGYQAVSTRSRPWLALNYAAISSRDRTKTAGSLAINPALVLRLGEGALTGSVEPLSADHSNNQADRSLRELLGHGFDVYKANFSLDKAEKGLSDADKQVIARVMTANAVPVTVFPGAVWLNSDGTLAGLSVVFPQMIDTDNQALLFVTIVLEGGGANPVSTTPPGPAQTVTVASLGDLVHQVVP